MRLQKGPATTSASSGTPLPRCAWTLELVVCLAAILLSSGVFAFGTFEAACSFGSLAAVAELLRQDTDTSRGLLFATVFCGGTA